MPLTKVKKQLLMACGFTSLGLGIVGAFVPLLPTVPFIILSAFCFSRGSETWHNWLMNHPKFGPALRDWEENGVIRKPAKIKAVTFIVISFFINVWILWERPHLIGTVALVLVPSVVFILTRPSRPVVKPGSPS